MINLSECNRFIEGLNPLYSCTQMGERMRIRTPFLYPDGDNIDLYCSMQSDNILISDVGETTRWLRMQSTTPRRSPKQKSLIEDICLTHGVEFYKGMLFARCRQIDSLAPTVIRVAQAALRVSDLWFTLRMRAVESFTDEVADFLSDRKFIFERGEKLTGKSGKVWSPDFHVRTIKRNSLVYLLSTGSRASARSIVYQVHTALYDLHYLSDGPEAIKFITLFDDTADVWSDEDFRLADQLSERTRWSQPDEFADALAEAA